VRKYLVTIVFKPEAKVAEITKELTDLVGEAGKVEGAEELALKKLAYMVGGSTEASIHQLRVSGPSSVVAEITEALRLNDQVLRFLVKSVPEPKEEVKSK